MYKERRGSGTGSTVRLLYINIYMYGGGVIIGGTGGGVCVLGVAYPGAAQGRYRFMIDIVTTFFG